jgi:hypothetical protein
MNFSVSLINHKRKNFKFKIKDFIWRSKKKRTVTFEKITYSSLLMIYFRGKCFVKKKKTISSQNITTASGVETKLFSFKIFIHLKK